MSPWKDGGNMAKNYNKQALLADYRAGNYTQRSLADKYGISAAMVSKLTIDAEKDLIEPVNKQIEARLALEGKSEQEVKAINYAVEFQLGLLKDIELFSNKAVKKASNLMDSTETGSDFKAIVEGVDKLSIMTKINNRHAPPAKIEQTNQTDVAAAMFLLADRLPN